MTATPQVRRKVLGRMVTDFSFSFPVQFFDLSSKTKPSASFVEILMEHLDVGIRKHQHYGK